MRADRYDSISSVRSSLPAPPTESQIDKLPEGVISHLLGGALERPDPAMRDYGERYLFEKILGEGGQGVVLEARDKVLQRAVAIKTLKEHTSGLREEQLEREALISGHLEHPNIPPTYDLGADESGSPFFVMRKVEGVSLDEIMRECRQAREAGKAPEYGRLRLLSLFLQVCNAIDYAHAQGVLHLDIKPQNVKLGTFGEVFVLDWGFAARKDETPKYVGGTPIYIAPERLRREPPDERSDVYSLGVLLYRLLTGERPYDVSGLSFKEYRERFEELRLIPPREQDPTIPLELDAIIRKAIAREREERYASVHQLAQDLQRFLDGVPVTAYQGGPAFRLWKFVRRHSLASALVAALAVALATAGAVAYRNRLLEAERRTAEAAAELRREAAIPFDKGRELLGKADPRLDWARGFFSKAIAIDHTFANAYFERGKLQMRLGAKNEALADFRQVIRLQPESLMAYYYSGIIQMDEKDKKIQDLAEAERLFQSMQQIDPDNEYSNLGLARIHILKRRYDEALALCDRISERNLGLTEVDFLRGDIYADKGGDRYEPEKALAAYDRYLAVPSDRSSAYANRGDILFALGRHDEALADYSTALSIDPDNIYALNNRGYLRYSVKKDADAALRDFERAQAVEPRYHWTYMNMGAVYEYRREWEKAEMAYNWALERHPDDPAILLRQGLCFQQQGLFPEAIERFTEALRFARASMLPAIHHRRGTARYMAGDYAGAKGDLEAALARQPDKPFYPAILLHIVRIRAGENPDPAPLQDLSERTPEKPWLAAIAKCWRGLVTPAEAAAAAPTPEAQCETRFYTAMYRQLVEQDSPSARRDLEACLATGVHLYNEYVLARHELGLHFSASGGGGAAATAPVPGDAP